VLVNTEQNKGMLENVPSRQFQDLSIIYRWVVDKDRDGISSTIVNNGLAEKLGMNEDQLYKVAVENTVRLFPPTVKSMNDVIRDMMMTDGMPGEIADMMIEDIPVDQQMYVITNSASVNGAASIVYSDALELLAEKLGTDLFVLPSSIHEVIAVSTNMGDAESLAEMVHEVNDGQVAMEEQLSDHVYRYDAKAHTLTLADTTIAKAQEVMVSENTKSYDIQIKYDITKNYLESIGFEWNTIDRDYIYRILDYCIKVGFVKQKMLYEV